MPALVISAASAGGVCRICSASPRAAFTAGTNLWAAATISGTVKCGILSAEARMLPLRGRAVQDGLQRVGAVQARGCRVFFGVDPLLLRIFPVRAVKEPGRLQL